MILHCERSDTGDYLMMILTSLPILFSKDVQITGIIAFGPSLDPFQPEL